MKKSYNKYNQVIKHQEQDLYESQKHRKTYSD